jgi:hypothetical protein
MNYLDLVTEGYFDENNREFLENYFLREYKKAEKEQFFEANEFFSGCMKVIECWENYLQKEVFERKKELYLLLNGAKNGKLLYDDLEGKTIEQLRQETIENCEKELEDVRPDGIGSISFTVNLSSLTEGRIRYNMDYNEVLQIKLSICKAFQKTQPQEEALPTQTINLNPFSVLQWATIFYYADETNLLSESRLLKTRLEQFMSKHQIETTFGNLINKYYEAKRRLNIKNDYPINKLELIKPFLKENYKQTVTKVENDIFFLKEEKTEN